MHASTFCWRRRHVMPMAIIGLLSAAATVAVITEGSTAKTSPPASLCPRDRVSLIAHRGTGPGTRRVGERRYSENTVPAFEEAMRLGADGFETDYWPTRDGRILSNHDATLDRTTNGSG